MRRVESPSIAPVADVYLVLDDFGNLGTAYRETDVNLANEETVIRFMLEGQYECPQRVVCFNTAEGRARDVSGDIARAVAVAALSKDISLTPGIDEFVERHLDDRLSMSNEGAP